MSKPQLDLFGLDQDENPLKGMVHANDPETSIEAAASLVPKLNSLQIEVMEAFRANGNLTDEELEELPQFAHYGPSTIRKRRSELYQMGQLEMAGKRKNSRGQPMMIWRITP